jgi:ligand-binding sensor domain-containing protein/signal transduction histidine kinase
MAGPGPIVWSVFTRAVVLACMAVFALSADRLDAPLQFRHLTAEDGLSHSWITALLQDRQGFMWIGTSAGLNRYDGYSFNIYSRVRSDPGSLLDSSVNWLFEDGQGRLWVGHGRGLSLYRPATDDFLNFAETQGAEAIGVKKPGTAVRCILEDPSGSLWLATDSGLVLFDPEARKTRRYLHHPDDANSLSGNDVRFMVRDKAGNLWVSNSRGLDRLDPRTGQVTRYAAYLPTQDVTQLAIDRFDHLWIGTAAGLCRLALDSADQPAFDCFRADRRNPRSLASDYVRVLFADRGGQIWIGTENGGLDRFDHQTGTFIHCRSDPDRLSSLNNDSVYSLAQDRTGTLWVGTFAGGVNLSRRNGEAIRHFHSIPGNPNSLSYDSIAGFFEDRDGYIWISTDGGGLNRFDPRTHSFKHWTTKNSGLTRDAVLDVYDDGRGKLLIGTWAGGLNIFDPRRNSFQAMTTQNSKLPSDSIFEIARDRRGRLLLGTYQHGLVVYDPSDESVKSYVAGESPLGANVVLIQEDSEGDFLIGTEAGLMLFRPGNDSMATFHHDDRNPTSITGDKIFSILEIEDGASYVGTDQGLDRFDKRSGQFFRVNAAFPGQEIRSMAKDKRGDIWIGTNRGLCRYNPRTGEVKKFNRADGTLGHDFNRCAYLTASDGTIYLGGLNRGFNIIHPDRITENKIPPPVVITDFRIANARVLPGPDSPLKQPIGMTREIHLSHQQSSFSFELAALDFSNPDANNYAYRLEGFDREWNKVGPHRTAAYTNIGSGSYVFRALAANSDGYWNLEGATVALRIHPPFWGTLWFRLLAIVLVTGAITMAVLAARRRRIILETMNTQLNEEIMHARKAEEALCEARDLLEEKVRERTAELTERANQLRILAGELTLTEQRERRRLAGVLHDHLQQLLVGASLRVGFLTRAEDPLVKQKAREIQELLNESIEASRSLTAELSPPVLYEGGLGAGLQWLALWMTEKHALTVHLVLQEKETAAAEDVSVLLFESVRELLFNVVKHARVQSANVSVRTVQPGMLEITVSDAGVGFDPASLENTRQAGGFGLFSIRERLRSIGGRLEITSSPGRGVRVKLLGPAQRMDPAVNNLPVDQHPKAS